MDSPHPGGVLVGQAAEVMKEVVSAQVCQADHLHDTFALLPSRIPMY